MSERAKNNPKWNSNKNIYTIIYKIDKGLIKKIFYKID